MNFSKLALALTGLLATQAVAINIGDDPKKDPNSPCEKCKASCAAKPFPGFTCQQVCQNIW
ncbi:hypothetical protein Tdes44962_MAKER09420 [Teratosphaeria destructans]|uniref:Uncharacterized protein n=1 Tax=Teratosphaeria destructans TaxID=418781 RepID=A0A9W7STD5_9PEZI|nr:hypothetical protein Tdes44962_MAKER09420 [Teratosphaeria destructans]